MGAMAREKVYVCSCGWGGSTVEMEWGGGSSCGVKGEVEKDSEGAAPLFFKWKSYSASIYDQWLLPLQNLQTPSHTHKHTRTQTKRAS